MDSQISPRRVPVLVKSSPSLLKSGMRVRPQSDEDAPPPPPPAPYADIVAEKIRNNTLDGIPSFTNDETHYLDAFPEAIKMAVMNIADCSCIAPEIVAAQFLHLGSVCICGSRSIVLPCRNWVQRANLYLLFLGQSATGKSRSMDAIMKYVDEDEAQRKEEFQQQMLEYHVREEEWKEMPKKEKKEILERQRKMNDDNPLKYEWPPRKPKNIQYTLSNSTMEAAIERMSDNPSGLTWTIDEFFTFLKGLSRYSKNDSGENISTLITTYEGGKTNLTRKSKDGKTDEVYEKFGLFAMTGNLQPKRLHEVFSKADLERGLPSRFAYVYPDTPIQQIDKKKRIDPEATKLLKILTSKMLEMRIYKDECGQATFPKPYVICEEAENEFIEVYNSVMSSANDTSHFDFAVRAVARILRVALILHVFKIVLQQTTFTSTTSTQLLMDDEERNISNTIKLKMPSIDEKVVSAETMREAIIITNWLTSYTNQVLPEMFPKIFSYDTDEITAQNKNIGYFTEFLADNREFCAEPHTANEILKRGLLHEVEDGKSKSHCLGHFFKQLGVKKVHTRNGAAYTLSTWKEPK